ncbi:hypothetical protein C8J56DRAFT_258001 [Mycena floridula]|nr:hypothetical protein C8J56DRAFT_258001 [Mycena floridula]
MSILRLRYGFIEPWLIQREVSNDPLNAQEAVQFHAASTQWLCGKSDSSFIEPRCARAIVAAFPRHNIPPLDEYNDLFQQHPRFLGKTKNRRFRISIEASSTMLLYTIEDLTSPVRIRVTDATSVLHVLRDVQLSDIYDVLTEFLRNGVEFSPLVPGATDQPRPQGFHLGFRDLDWTPKTAEDYQSYSVARDAFLRHPVIARAALSAGGLIWRLAVEANGDQLLDGRNYLDGYSTCTLNDDDLQAICGAYRRLAKTRPSDNGRPIDQFCPGCYSEPGWFPKPSAWKISALAIGIWNESAEEWYQKMLVRIRHNNPSFRTQKKWRSSVALQRKMVKTWERVRAAAENSIREIVQ